MLFPYILPYFQSWNNNHHFIPHFLPQNTVIFCERVEFYEDCLWLLWEKQWRMKQLCFCSLHNSDCDGELCWSVSLHRGQKKAFSVLLPFPMHRNRVNIVAEPIPAWKEILFILSQTSHLYLQDCAKTGTYENVRCWVPPIRFGDSQHL